MNEWQWALCTAIAMVDVAVLVIGYRRVKACKD